MIAPIVSVASKSLLAPIASDFANDRSDRDDRGDHMRTSFNHVFLNEELIEIHCTLFFSESLLHMENRETKFNFLL